jgi:hypothetical protein
MTGIRAFMLRHTCTDVCKQMGLQLLASKDIPDENSAQIASGGSSAAEVSSRLAASSSLPPSASARREPAAASLVVAKEKETTQSPIRPKPTAADKSDKVFDSIMGKKSPTAGGKAPNSALEAAEKDLLGHLDSLDID